MIPLEKVQDIIAKHDSLEKELSSSDLDKKLFAQKSKEYSNLGTIISFAKEYLNFDKEKKDLEQIIEDKKSDTEIVEMAEKDLTHLKIKKQDYENKLKIFTLISNTNLVFTECTEYQKLKLKVEFILQQPQ